MPGRASRVRRRAAGRAGADTYFKKTRFEGWTQRREDAVHAVLNATNEPRFSVNFRLGGFDKIFHDNAKPADVPKALAFAGAGKRMRDAAAADDDAPKVPRKVAKELEIAMYN